MVWKIRSMLMCIIFRYWLTVLLSNLMKNCSRRKRGFLIYHTYCKYANNVENYCVVNTRKYLVLGYYLCTTACMFAFRLPHKTAFYLWKRLYYVNFCISALTRAKWEFHKQCLVPSMTLLHIDEKHHNNLCYVLWAFCENIQNIPNETSHIWTQNLCICNTA